MTRDLDQTLSELGPEYRTLVGRLQAPFKPAVSFRPYLLAASLVVVVGLAVICRNGGSGEGRSLDPRVARAPAVYTAAYASGEAAIRSILADQRRDGSWSNDYLTRQNAAALRHIESEEARIAFKRAVRYLRTKGLGPLSETEFEHLSVRENLGLQAPKSA